MSFTMSGYEELEVTYRDIEFGAVHRTKEFSLRKNFMVIPNCSYGAFTWGEADLISVLKSRYLVEGEIKVSISDLKADFKKKKYKRYKDDWLSDIKKHYFIVPSKIKDKALEIIKDTNSGLIYVSKTKRGISAFTMKEAKPNKLAKKFDESKLLKICRLIGFRYWKVKLEK